MLRLCSVVLLLLVPATVAAQGRITGVVRDAEGHAIKGATVTAENPNIGPSTASSDAKGRYGFLGLRGGTWTLTVQAPGFVPEKRQITTRTMGTNPPVDFELQAAPDAAPTGPTANVDVNALQEQLDKAAQLDQADKIDEAIAAYRAVLNRVPALTSVHLQLGALFERKHDNASAIVEYQAALKGDPASTKARAALDRLARQ
jgi:tetratricopeptide (TPR) repeat protein